MSQFRKILVVDDGARSAEHALSAELAELGFASVTTSFEATEDVLELLAAPVAILLQLPRKAGLDYDRFIELADRLKAKQSISGVPIIMVEGPPVTYAGGYASVLENELGTRALTTLEG